jgi:LmbE family N-acetylglucosaminyl deacetylase
MNKTDKWEIPVITKNVAVIVAHPDDETLWVGGTILSRPDWNWFIVTMCRASDPDRSVRFNSVLKILHCKGIMGDMDDGPEQEPLSQEIVKKTLLSLLPAEKYDLVITHSPAGEYTRHRRHEETGEAVIGLWLSGKISAPELWTFAYEDDMKNKYPEAIKGADIIHPLGSNIWLQKYSVITGAYGFKKGGFEAETTPKIEAFWRFSDKDDTRKWMNQNYTI